MSPTILIVDDEPAGRKVVESVLMNQGYTLEFASNGREALEKAAAIKPDLILLDLMLPEMDGMEVCQKIRSNRELAEMPVVMVTALDDRNTRIACLDAGADDFVSKPFDRAELRARVRSITRLNRYRLLHERNLITSWIAEKASDGYLQVTADDRILFANPRARFYLGLDTDQRKPIRETFKEVVSRQYMLHPESAWNGWPRSAVNTIQNRFLVRPESNTAHEFWMEAAIFETKASESSPRMRIIRLRDVTAEILNRRNTRSFGEAITHKIRTPVTHIVTSLDLLAHRVDLMTKEDIARISETAYHGAKRLHETLNRILHYSNIQTIKDTGNGFPVSGLMDLIGKISSEVGIDPGNVNFTSDIDTGNLSLPEQSLEVILWEVLGNSKKFHPHGKPTITVTVSRNSSSQIVIQITDDGLSLSPRQLSIAMLPYYQGEKDFTGEAPGMGLGLSTVSTIVWSVRGTCNIKNRDAGPGVTVELVIPEVLIRMSELDLRESLV